MSDARRWLTVEPLTAAAFRRYGEVLEIGAETPHRSINEGLAERYDALLRPDTQGDGGHPVVSIFRARPRALPLQLSRVERHRLGSQAFVPLAAQRFLVVVAEPGPPPAVEALRGFLATPGQGLSYARGVWHHPLLAIDDGGDFLVIDRAGPGAAQDCEERCLRGEGLWIRLGG